MILARPHADRRRPLPAAPSLQLMWRRSARTPARRTPRVVGETGGKVSSWRTSAIALRWRRPSSAAVSSSRAASRASRIYAPKSMWNVSATGSSRDRQTGWATFPTSATSWASSINGRSIASRVHRLRAPARRSSPAADAMRHGYFIKPTVAETADRTQTGRRIFGHGHCASMTMPWHETLELVDATSPRVDRCGVLADRRSGSRVGALCG